jgi:hypothetical protein
MSIPITAEQRDALYEQIIVRLNAIDDIPLVLCKGNFTAADRLAREHSDNLRLVLNDLGWGDRGSGETIELTSPPDLLRRFFARHLDLARDFSAVEAREQTEVEESQVANRLVIDTCTAGLTALDAELGIDNDEGRAIKC